METPKSISGATSLEKKAQEDLKKPEFWLNQIKDALELLAYHGYRQRTSEGIDSDPVDKATIQLGDAILALQKLGHKIPQIDLSGLPEEFISNMDIHPATAPFAKYFEQMKWKEELTKKWGTKEERSKKLKASSQAKKKWP